MTSEEALALIRKHSSRDVDFDQPTMPNSFLGSLRPFVGLREGNFHEIMAALRALAPSLDSDMIDREVISDLWFICWQANLIGLDVTGALQRNGVLSTEETGMLADWVFDIGFTVSRLLDGEDAAIAFADYDNKYGSR